MTQARAMRELQAATREARSWSPAPASRRAWSSSRVTREPRTHLTSGGFSTMGFTLPAAIGAKLAQPDRQVLAVAGDGDFLQTMQELAAAAMDRTPVCSSSSTTPAGSDQGRPAGALRAHRRHRLPARRRALLAPLRQHRPGVRHPRRCADAPDEVAPAVGRALATGGPSLVQVMVARDFAAAGPDKIGWWDVPVPEGRPVVRRAAGRQGGGAAPMSIPNAPIGRVPIIWNNADLLDLAPETASSACSTTSPASVSRHPAWPWLPRWRRAATPSSREPALRRAVLGDECRPRRPGCDAANIAHRDLARLVSGGGEVLVVAVDGGGERDRGAGGLGGRAANPVHPPETSVPSGLTRPYEPAPEVCQVDVLIAPHG